MTFCCYALTLAIGLPNLSYHAQRGEELYQKQIRAQVEIPKNIRISIEDWLSYPKSEFVQAADYVLHKNAE